MLLKAEFYAIELAFRNRAENLYPKVQENLSIVSKERDVLALNNKLTDS